jgi:hypothetical protein
MKTVYNLHRFWTLMSPIFASLHFNRMTEVLTLDIYEARWFCIGRSCLRGRIYEFGRDKF